MFDLFHTPIVVLHVIVCLMLMLVVLIQPGKSGGLGAALGGAGAQQIFGGRGAGNFLTRTTWIAATVFFVTSITLAYVSTSTGDSLEDLADVQILETPAEEAAAPSDTAGSAAPAPTEGAANDVAPAGSVPGEPDPASEAPASDQTAPAEPVPGTPAPAQP